MGNESDLPLQYGRQKAVYNGAAVLHDKEWALMKRWRSSRTVAAYVNPFYKIHCTWWSGFSKDKMQSCKI